MGAMKDYIDRHPEYSQFQKWMEQRGIKIRFDETVWGSVVFSDLFNQFEQEHKNAEILHRALSTMPIELLEQKLAERKKRATEAVKKPEKKIEIVGG